MLFAHDRDPAIDDELRDHPRRAGFQWDVAMEATEHGDVDAGSATASADAEAVPDPHPVEDHDLRAGRVQLLDELPGAVALP